jgi:hypothetical protein
MVKIKEPAHRRSQLGADDGQVPVKRDSGSDLLDLVGHVDGHREGQLSGLDGYG